MGQHYSLTNWSVKSGQEDEFVKRWGEFAEWSAAQGLSARAKLLRDVDQPGRFVSFGPWESLEAIRHWRTLPGFQERVARLDEVLDGFDPHTLEQAAER